MKQVLNGTINTSTQMLIFGSSKIQAPVARIPAKKMSKNITPTHDQGYNKKPNVAQMSRIQQPK